MGITLALWVNSQGPTCVQAAESCRAQRKHEDFGMAVASHLGGVPSAPSFPSDAETPPVEQHSGLSVACCDLGSKYCVHSLGK